MTLLQHNPPWPIRDRLRETAEAVRIGVRIPAPTRIIIVLATLFVLFLAAGTLLQRIDPAAGVLDIGILSLLLLGLLAGLAAIMCSLWLQELLWQPFKTFRKQFHTHFNRLSSWQQCILYFSVFFLLLYAVLWGLAMVL